MKQLLCGAIVVLVGCQSQALSPVPPAGMPPLLVAQQRQLTPIDPGQLLVPKLYVVAEGTNELTIYNRANGTPIGSPITDGVNAPAAVAVDAAGKMYVANHDTITTYLPSGKRTTPTITQLVNQPRGVAVDSAGNIYVANLGNDSLTKYGADGALHMTISPLFDDLGGVAVDSSGKIYVTETEGDIVKSYLPNGTRTAPTIFPLSDPSAIAVDGNGKIYVTSLRNNHVWTYNPDGTSTRPGPFGKFDHPKGVAVAAEGSIYVTSQGGDAVYAYSSNSGVLVGSSILAHVSRPTGVAVSLPRTADVASGFRYPRYIAVDGNANVYVSDSATQSIRMIAPNGMVTQVGSGLKSPDGIAVDGSGDVYVADSSNHAVKKIAPPFDNATHGTITVIDGGPKDPYLTPRGIAFDGRRYLYVTAESYSALAAAHISALRVYDTQSKNKESMLYWNRVRNEELLDVTLDPFCSPAAGNPCGIYAGIIGSDRIPFIRKFQFDGHFSDINIEKPGFYPNGGILVNDSRLYVASARNNAIDEIAGKAFTQVGSGWQSPYGLATASGCRTLCTLYASEVPGGNGSVRAYVP